MKNFIELQSLNYNHPKELYLISASKLLERIGFYSFRSIFFLIAIGGMLNMKNQDFTNLYLIFTLSITLAPPIMGLLGDFVLGHRWACITGSVLRSIGMFLMCDPTPTMFYIGLVCISLGTSLYSPNAMAMLSNSYSDKSNLRDAGFSVLYFSLNLGGLLSMIPMLVYGENNLNSTLIFAGGISLLSIIPLFFSSKNEASKNEKTTFPLEKRTLNILFGLGILFVFWLAYDLGDSANIEKSMNFKLILSPSFSLNNMLLLGIISALFSLGLSILWTKYHISLFNKLILALFCGTLGTTLFFIIGDPNQYILLFLLAMCLLTMAECILNPTIYSLFSTYISPKFTASCMGLVFIPSAFFHYLVPAITSVVGGKSIALFTISIAIFALTGLGILIFTFMRGTQKKSEVFDHDFENGER